MIFITSGHAQSVPKSNIIGPTNDSLVLRLKAKTAKFQIGKPMCLSEGLLLV